MCGIFGTMGTERAVGLTKLGLHALQHRGQESAGIAASDGLELFLERGMGLVDRVFADKPDHPSSGTLAIGHVRYSTAGVSKLCDAQPFLVETKYGQVAIVHNGNLPYSEELRAILVSEGAVFQTSSDTDIVLHQIARSRKPTLIEAIIETLERPQLQGAFSMIFLTPDSLIAVRDPQGFRPLCIGRLGTIWVLASETCAFELIDADYVRDVEPGEIIEFRSDGYNTIHQLPQKPSSHCIFEHVYFARPDSVVFGGSVNESRHKAGRILAREWPCPDATMIVPVPDSGMVAAAGFAQESGIRLRPTGIVRNHYVGRTFIDPDPLIRDLKIKLKLSPNRHLLTGQKVILVDDSIVRGTTMNKIVGMVRAAGALEVHVRIACPPTIAPCYFGVDTPNHEELVAASSTVEQIRALTGADSLGYLSLTGLIESCDNQHRTLQWCTGCYNNVYPLAITSRAKTQREQIAGGI